MADTIKKVTYAEALPIKGKRIGQFLQTELAPKSQWTLYGGGRPGAQETVEYEIVEQNRGRKLIKRLVLAFMGVEYRRLVACLSFGNGLRGSTHHKWVLSVYGREHVDYLKMIAEKLATKFDVEIHVKLESEESN